MPSLGTITTSDESDCQTIRTNGAVDTASIVHVDSGHVTWTRTTTSSAQRSSLWNIRRRPKRGGVAASERGTDGSLSRQGSAMAGMSACGPRRCRRCRWLPVGPDGATPFKKAVAGSRGGGPDRAKTLEAGLRWNAEAWIGSRSAREVEAGRMPASFSRLSCVASIARW